MRLKQFVLISLSFGMFASCTEKNDTDNSGSSNASSCKPISVSLEGKKYLEFTYNPGKKIETIKAFDFDSQALLAVSTISYTDTSVTYITLEPQSQQEDYVTIYKLNAKGLAVLKLRKGNFANGAIFDTTRYEYDSESYLIKESYHRYFNLYTITNENLVKIERYDSVGAVPYVTLFEASTELRKYPYFFEDISDDYFAQNMLGLCGKLSKNLMSKQTRVSGNGNRVSQFTYMFDAKKDVSIVSITEDNQTAVINYNYDCK